MKQNITTNRGDFNVRIYGDEKKPPLFLVHGFPQTSYSWHHVTSYLQDFYVVAVDLRGMGDSNRNTAVNLYEKDQMASDIFAIADELEIEQFFLAGHDWGGAIAQEMTFLNPQRIRKLIVINMIIINNAIGEAKANEILIPQSFRSSWYQFFLSIKEFPEAMIAGKEEVWVRFFSRGISNPIPEDAIQEYIRCYKIPNTITTVANIYRTLNKDRKRWKKYLGVKNEVPTYLIHGILDPVIIKEYLEGVETCFNQVKIKQIKGGHFIVDEQPELVGKAMADFLLKK